MKKHRKLVALLVALTFLFSVVAPVMAAEQPSAAEKAADKLNVLGIIEGYPDGSFGLDRNITRAEFAKVAVVAAGLADAEPLLKATPSKFSDVPTGEWFTGWINLAASQGFVKGDPAGTFRPNDNISYAEVVTVLLRLLGYNDNLPGDWPTNYLAKAVQLEITKGVALDAGAAALRGSVFMMVDKTLDTPMVEWSNDKQAFSEKKEDGVAVRLIAKSFEGSMKEGLVTDIEWDARGQLFVEIRGIGKSDMNDAATFQVSDNAVVTGAADVAALLGSNVNYVVDKDDNLVYAAAKDTKTVEKSSAEFIDSDKIKIDNKTYNLAKGFGYTFFPGTGSVSGNKLTGDKVVVVLNGSGDAQWAFVYTYANGDVIDEIDGNRIYGKNSSYTKGSNDTVIVIRDGALASFGDLSEGDLFYVERNSDRGVNAIISAVSKVSEGVLEEYSTDQDKVTISGVKYDAATGMLASDNDGKDFLTNNLNKDMVDKEVSYMLSPSGRVAVIISGVKAVSSDKFGILLAAQEKDNFNDARVKVFNAEGKTVTYSVDTSKVEVSGPDPNNNGNVTFKEANTSSTIFIFNANSPMLVKYRLNNDGEVSFVEKATSQAAATRHDGNRIQFTAGGGTSWLLVGENANVFAAKEVDSSKNPPNPTKWTTASWDEFKNGIDGSTYGSTSGLSPVTYFTNSKGQVVAMYYPGRLTSGIEYGVVAGKGYNAKGLYYDLFHNGEKVRYNVVEGSSVPANIDNKTIVRFTLVDGKIDTMVTETSGPIEVATGVVSNATSQVIMIGSTPYSIDSKVTTIVDISGSSPVKVTSVPRNAYVKIVNDEDSKNEKDIYKLVVIIPEPPTLDTDFAFSIGAGSTAVVATSSSSVFGRSITVTVYASPAIDWHSAVNNYVVELDANLFTVKIGGKDVAARSAYVASSQGYDSVADKVTFTINFDVDVYQGQQLQIGAGAIVIKGNEVTTLKNTAKVKAGSILIQ